MERFFADFHQLERLDGPSLPPPRPLPPAKRRRELPPRERAALISALDFAKALNLPLGALPEIVNIGVSPPAVTVLGPAAMPVGFALSKSRDLTVAGALAVSAFAGGGIVGSGGVYGSTTKEIGLFLTGGVGIFSNIGLSAGGEYTFILGTPLDFSGPYFSAGVSVSGPPPLGVGGMLLFAPSMPLTIPLTLTLMGFSVSITASTPSPIPVTVTLQVTDTKIWPALHF